MIQKRPPWLVASPGVPAIAISTRIRLARNIEAFPFPGRCSDDQRRDVISAVTEAAKGATALRTAQLLMIEALTPVDKQLLVERRLASPEFVRQAAPAALLVTPDETCSIMINEEDHLRMQVLRPELHIDHAWSSVDELDTQLEESLQYAYSSRFGYLTACPTNVGTGLRVSVMLHLPALVHEHKIGGVISAVGKIGIAVRGFYGENSEAQGHLFQVSNQVTLGRGESDIIRQLQQIVGRIIDHEAKLRETLIKNAPHQIRNDVGRAFGTLKYAEILTSQEATELLSVLLMGIDLHVFDEIDRATVSQLMIDTQPAHVQILCGKELTTEQRDLERARIIRERLNTRADHA
ncbi:protein arginine kinase [bacterium]|nr:protein arginine kinase [bacterium]